MSPRYTVAAETRGEVDIFILREADIASAAIAPAWGNNCFMLQVHEPVLESVAFEEFRTRPTSYGIPILFPFPNRLRDGALSFRGQRYVVNPNRHGFVRDKAWRVLKTGASAEEGAWITSRFEAGQYAAAIPLSVLSRCDLSVTGGRPEHGDCGAQHWSARHAYGVWDSPLLSLSCAGHAVGTSAATLGTGG
jgi:D-hexose-6-phosphate mutarotase